MHILKPDLILLQLFGAKDQLPILHLQQPIPQEQRRTPLEHQAIRRNYFILARGGPSLHPLLLPL